MLVLLTRILLWATIGLIIWYILLKFIPRKYLTWFGGVIVLLLIVASFLDPDDQTIGTIWRLISLPLSPLGLTVLLLGFSLSDGLAKARGQQVAIALAILLFSSMPIVARLLAAQAEQSVQQAYIDRQTICDGVCPATIPDSQGNFGNAAAIVVFGQPSEAASLGTVNPSVGLAYPRPDDVANDAELVPRLIYAANLYQRTSSRPPVIVTAGPSSGAANREAKEQFIRSTLQRNGVAAEDIRIISTGTNVRATANDVENYLTGQNILRPAASRTESGDRRVVLVAPAISMARSALTFEQLGIQTIAKPTDFYTNQAVRDGDLFARLPDILPNVQALEVTSRYWDEFLTSIYYFLRGWLPGFEFGWNPNIEI